MSDDQIVYSSACYCALCDRYFPDVLSRADHIQFSQDHPNCDKCNRRFANKNALRNHFTISRRHHYCSLCRMHFRTAAGFRAHVEYASVHCDDSDDEDDHGDFDYSYDGWEDDVGLARFPDENDEWVEPPVVFDDVIDPEDEYWDEDDELDPREEDYNGWAPVPPEAGTASIPAPAPTSHSHVDTAQTSKGTSPEASKETPLPDTSRETAIGCPLCLENACQPSVTRCGHIFCSSCIGHALDVKRSCPVCRVPAGPKQLRRVFFSTPAA